MIVKVVNRQHHPIEDVQRYYKDTPAHVNSDAHPPPGYREEQLNVPTCNEKRHLNMEYTEEERRNMELGKKKIDAMAFGFFNLPFTANEPPRRAASAMQANDEFDRSKQPQRSNSESDKENPSVQHIMMFPSDQGEPLPFLATLDTGTTANWISEDALRRLRIKSVYEAPTEWITFNGKTVCSERVAEITWNGAPNRSTRITTFQIAKHVPFDVILGSNLVFTDGIFSFNEPAWILAKKPLTKEEAKVMEEKRALANKDSEILEIKRKATGLAMRKRKEAERTERGKRK